MSPYRSSQEYEKDSQQEADADEIVDQPEIQKSPGQTEQDSQCRTFGCGMGAGVYIWKAQHSTALNILTKLPAMIKTAATASPITVIFDQRPFPDRLGYGHGADKGQDTQQEDHFKKCGCS